MKQVGELEVQYPALYLSADVAARKQQRSYFGLLVLQFALLLAASFTSAILRELNPQLGSKFYFLFLCVGAVVTLYASLKAPERDWYFARALAESAKTLSWLYMMAAEPFQRSMKPNVAVAEYTAALAHILSTNRDSGRILAMSIAPGSQVTTDMERVRFLELPKRRNIYLSKRIDDQLKWYTENARSNSLRAKVLGLLCIGVYVSGLLIAASNLNLADGSFLSFDIDWMTEPLLVIATSMIGWMQAKRYSELAATYSLAMHEIAQVRENVLRVTNEKDFAKIVRDSEAAFSREHTQWTARQIARMGKE